jgi:hypothetical protein
MSTILIFVALYVLGIFIIGLPMAWLSLKFFLMEKLLDEGRYWPLRLVRNFLHPFSFVLTPEYEYKYGPRRNYQMHYEGMVGDIMTLGPSREREINKYLILSSLSWPFRLWFLLFSWLVTLGFWVIGLPFLLIGLMVGGVSKKPQSR